MNKARLSNLPKLLRVPLTNKDLNNYGILEKDIILYSELDNLHDIEELLPHNKTFKIVLIEYKQNSGHWVMIMRCNDTLEYFNSFGLFPSDNDFINDDILNEQLNQEELFLNKLFHKEMNEDDFKNLVYNKKEFQDDQDETMMTCGRHCVHRLMCLKYQDMDLKEYIKYMEELKKKTGLDYDELVCYFID